MNRYLLDTHSLLWAILEPEKLGKQAISILEDVDNRVFVSSITFWEISLKYSIGKLMLSCNPDDLLTIVDEMEFEKMPLMAEETALFYQLPRLLHKDPFDRMLIWQAISHDLVLISKDGKFEDYEQYGLKVVW
ncbi:MAG: type II toxin-antitoxin system VapC family toxin [Methylococcales bacterium]|nr:type II toxin-antitoxin system VapC family toxin [Methylococcales bacterium]